MFDFSIGELMIVMVVALVVIGPERLPKVARTLGLLWGRARRYVNGVRSDIERDLAVEEFRQLQQKVKDEASSLEQSVTQASASVDQQVKEINEAVADLATPEEMMRDAPSIEPAPSPSRDASSSNSTGKS